MNEKLNSSKFRKKYKTNFKIKHTEQAKSKIEQFLISNDFTSKLTDDDF